MVVVFFFSSRRRHTRCSRDWSSDVCSSDLDGLAVSCRSLGTPTRRPVVCVPEISPKDVVLGIQLNGLFKLGSRIGITMHLKIGRGQVGTRLEEHTSELQSRLHLVCRLLLEKKHDLY